MRRFLLIVFCLLPALASAADRNNLARILVTGSQRYHEDDLVRATGLTLNTQVTADDLQTAANRLGDSGAFTSVQYLFKSAIGAKGLEADFQVTDAEKFLPAVFENFVWFSEDTLQQTVHQAIPLYNGQLPTSGSMSDEVSAVLSKFLSSKGLPSEVSYLLAAEFDQPPSAYKFMVTNANLKIQDVNLSGAAHMLPEQWSKSVSPLKGTVYLHSDVATVLQKNLLPIYYEHGYLKVAIAEIKPKIEEKNLVTVDVGVIEGDQYRLGGFSWRGNTLISSDELSKHISLKPGEPVNAPQLDRDLAQVRKLFGKVGREGVTINAVPAFNGNAVSYSFQVAEGELYHMGKLEIQGVEPDQARKLAQGWKLGEGEPYDATYLEQFLAHTLLRVPGHKWRWMTFEQIDDAQKTVNVRLQVKIE